MPKQSARATNNSSASLGFDVQMWQATDAFRGSVEAPNAPGTSLNRVLRRNRGIYAE